MMMRVRASARYQTRLKHLLASSNAIATSGGGGQCCGAKNVMAVAEVSTSAWLEQQRSPPGAPIRPPSFLRLETGSPRLDVPQQIPRPPSAGTAEPPVVEEEIQIHDEPKPGVAAITASVAEGVPIDQLLAPAFLALFDADELFMSWTIWDHCAEHFRVATRGYGLQPAASAEELVESLVPFLATSVVDQVRRTLEALEDSTLGKHVALLPSLNNILGTILMDLKMQAYPPGSIPGLDREALRRADRRCRLSRLDRGEGDDGGDDHDDEVDARWKLLERDAQFFRDIPRIMVIMDVYNQQAQNLSIAERAQRFAQHVSATTQHVPYSPYREDGVACFYHGRYLLLSNAFTVAGIRPLKCRTEFSFGRAFYVTNSITAAFEFPLHSRLARDPQDTVAVFCFELDLKILHGDVAGPSGEKFRVCRFEEDIDDESWEHFCVAHLYGKPQAHHSYDIVIGSMCVPNWYNNSVMPYREIRGLYQVAFCSRAAWTWVGSCVRRMFIEEKASSRI